jgi:Flp pilus assembly protein TadD
MRMRFSNRFFQLITPVAILAVAVVLLAVNLLEMFRPPDHLKDGLAAFGRGEYARAIRDCARAVRACETDVAAHFQLGAAYHNYGWHDEALREYNATWDIGRYNCTRAMHSAARIWAQRNDVAQATEHFNRALAISPESADIWYEFGALLGNAGDTNGAVFCAQKALELVPGNQQFARLLHMYRTPDAAPDPARVNAP